MRSFIGALLFVASAAANAASLSASPTSLPPGGSSVTATWSGIVSPSATDWIGLHVPGSPHASYFAWRYSTGAASGSVPFSVPASVQIGTYELRLFANDGYTLLAISNPFTISGGNLSVAPSVAAPGASVTASWSAIPAPSPTDWVGLYTPSGVNTSPIVWQYTNGAASGGAPFSLPGGLALGTYQLRLFSNNGYTLLAVSNSLAVGPTLTGMVSLDGSPLAGVTLGATNGASCSASNASGQYSCAVPSGWSGTVTPSLPDTVFTPASRSYTNVTAAQSAQNYVAQATIYQVSGTVTLNGLALPNVAFAATGGVTCTSSNGAGQYSCAVPLDWSGSVTPSASGYSFGPASRSYTSVSSHQTAQTFTATLDTATAPLYFVHVDHLNTPRLVANQAQQGVWRWDQTEPFGNNVPDENPSALGVFEFPLRFPGQYADKETNLYYNYFRDYDAALGRYTQSDPIGLDGGINTFAYTGSSPLLYSDAEGTSYAALGAGMLIGGIGGGLGAAATGGNVWTGMAIGVAAGGAVAAAPAVLPTLAGVGGMVTLRVVAGGLGNALSQFLNVQSNPCASFNYGSFVASAAGGYASGLRAAGIAQAGLPTTGMAGFTQRAIAGISGAGTATTIGIIGTSLGNQANASDPSTSGSSCCAPNSCCSPQR